MSMTYYYQGFKNGSANSELWGQVTNALSKLSVTAQNTAKIGASDEQNDDARAIIITSNDTPTNISESYLSDSWTSVYFEDGDITKLSQECVNWLNDDDNGVAPSQKYYARLAYTNHKGGDSRLVLFYRGISNQ